jgi:AAA domain
MYRRLHRDLVFVAGGQPSVTYVDRQEFHVERTVARAIAAPNQVVSLAGPSKTGKTVLCRKVLGDREYIWIDGGEIGSAQSLWKSVCSELNLPVEVTTSDENSSGVNGGLSLNFTSAKGSKLQRRGTSEKRIINSTRDALDALVADNIILVVDDFHYLNPETRTTFLRNVKGAVFSGLKVLLLSVTHRAFDAIKAESELTGRFASITLPDWTKDELKKIPSLGFHALAGNLLADTLPGVAG